MWYGLLVLFTLAGCSGKTTLESFMREDVDLGFITRVAVLPYENHSRDEFADERVRDITITQILAYGLFDVVDKGQVDSVLRDEAVDLGEPMDAATLKRLGQRLNVQAFMLGSIDYVGEGRKGAVVYPELSITMRLLEVNSAMILWQASGNRNGDSLVGRLFGIAPADTYRVSMYLVRQLLASIPAIPAAAAPAPAPASVQPASPAVTN